MHKILESFHCKLLFRTTNRREKISYFCKNFARSAEKDAPFVGTLLLEEKLDAFYTCYLTYIENNEKETCLLSV